MSISTVFSHIKISRQSVQLLDVMVNVSNTVNPKTAISMMILSAVYCDKADHDHFRRKFFEEKYAEWASKNETAPAEDYSFYVNDNLVSFQYVAL